MLEEPNHIDDLFNDFLHDHEENVPFYVWNNLKEELKARKRFRILQRLKMLAASVALLISFGLGYYVSDIETTHSKSLSNTNRKIFFREYLNTLEDSLNFIEETSIKKEKLQKKKEKISIDNNQNKKDADVFDTSYLFRKYKYLLSFFSEKEKGRKNIAENTQKPNQLLTDTLLLRKENLQTEGFPSLKTEKEKQSAWSFGTKFSPVFAVEESGGSNQSTSNIKSEVNSGIKDIKPDEKPVTSFTGGINVNYQLNERFSIESGLFYLNKRQTADNLIASKDDEFGNSNYIIYTPNQSIPMQDIGNANVLKQSYSRTYYSLDASYITNAEYIELPLILRYRIINQKLGLDVLSGISTNFLVNNNSYILSNNAKLWSDNSDLSPVLYGATLGFGLNYRFYQNFSFNLEPTFKYSFLPENSVFRKYPYSFAVFAGFSYRFK